MLRYCIGDYVPCSSGTPSYISTAPQPGLFSIAFSDSLSSPFLRLDSSIIDPTTADSHSAVPVPSIKFGMENSKISTISFNFSIWNSGTAELEKLSPTDAFTLLGQQPQILTYKKGNGTNTINGNSSNGVFTLASGSEIDPTAIDGIFLRYTIYGATMIFAFGN